MRRIIAYVGIALYLALGVLAFGQINVQVESSGANQGKFTNPLVVPANSGTAANQFANGATTQAALDEKAPKDIPVYILTCFTRNDERLYVNWSTDGKGFTKFGGARNYYTPPAGDNIRDIGLTKIGNVFYAAYTAGIFGAVNYFNVIKSTDLVNWEFVTRVDCSGAGTVSYTWGPEFFIDDDGTVRIYIALSTNGVNLKTYELHATNSTLTAWTTPTLVTGTGWPADYLENSMVKIGSNYHLFYTNRATGFIAHATSTSPASGFTQVWDGSTDVVGSGNCEGVFVMQKADGKYRFYYDISDFETPADDLGIHFIDAEGEEGNPFADFGDPQQISGVSDEVANRPKNGAVLYLGQGPEVIGIVEAAELSLKKAGQDFPNVFSDIQKMDAGLTLTGSSTFTGTINGNFTRSGTTTGGVLSGATLSTTTLSGLTTVSGTTSGNITRSGTTTGGMLASGTLTDPLISGTVGGSQVHTGTISIIQSATDTFGANNILTRQNADLRQISPSQTFLIEDFQTSSGATNRYGRNDWRQAASFSGSGGNFTTGPIPGGSGRFFLQLQASGTANTAVGLWNSINVRPSTFTKMKGLFWVRLAQTTDMKFQIGSSLVVSGTTFGETSAWAFEADSAQTNWRVHVSGTYTDLGVALGTGDIILQIRSDGTNLYATAGSGAEFNVGAVSSVPNAVYPFMSLISTTGTTKEVKVFQYNMFGEGSTLVPSFTRTGY